MEEGVVGEAVGEEEDRVGQSQGGAGVEGAVLPGASCQEEDGDVDLRPDRGEEQQLDRTH